MNNEQWTNVYCLIVSTIPSKLAPLRCKSRDEVMWRSHRCDTLHRLCDFSTLPRTLAHEYIIITLVVIFIKCMCVCVCVPCVCGSGSCVCVCVKLFDQEF
jgi:hypothetical protein